MQYTPDQLVALVEEARGHVHEVMMGAIWTKERYEQCRKFLEKTDVVEYRPLAGTSAPNDTLVERALAPSRKRGNNPEVGVLTIIPSRPAEQITIAADVSDVLGRAFNQDEKIIPKRPRGRPRKDAVQPTDNYLPVPVGKLSIDEEVAWLRKYNHSTLSRDALRVIVKARRDKKAG